MRNDIDKNDIGGFCLPEADDWTLLADVTLGLMLGQSPQQLLCAGRAATPWTGVLVSTNRGRGRFDLRLIISLAETGGRRVQGEKIRR